MLKDLPLPYTFHTQSVEGVVEVYIDITPVDEPYFQVQDCKPYMFSVRKLNLWDDVDGDTTIEELREIIANFQP